MEKAEEILTSSQNPIGQSRTPQNVAHLPQDEVIERALILPECMFSSFDWQIAFSYSYYLV
jgi:hypothetical protein